jgi:hypothetical protein
MGRLRVALHQGHAEGAPVWIMVSICIAIATGLASLMVALPTCSQSRSSSTTTSCRYTDGSYRSKGGLRSAQRSASSSDSTRSLPVQSAVPAVCQRLSRPSVAMADSWNQRNSLCCCSCQCSLHRCIVGAVRAADRVNHRCMGAASTLTVITQ